MGPPLILGSASPRRRELLSDIVDSFDVVVPGMREDMGGPVEAVAVRLATEKAATVLARHAGTIVLAADTVVALGDRHYDKPADASEAVSMLRALRGRAHIVYTAVAVASQHHAAVAQSASKVHMAALDEGAIARYVASGRPLDKAGAYGIQDDDVPTVERVEGCYCGVMGLPLWLAHRLLADAGVVAREPTLSRCAVCPERFLGTLPVAQGVVPDATSE